MGTAQGTAPGATTAGQLGQAANPQMADPMQNMNNRGLPNMRRPPASGQPAMLPGGVSGAQRGQISPIRQLTQLPGGRPGGVSNPTWGAPGAQGGQISPLRATSQPGSAPPGASNFMSLDKVRTLPGVSQQGGLAPGAPARIPTRQGAPLGSVAPSASDFMRIAPMQSVPQQQGAQLRQQAIGSLQPVRGIQPMQAMGGNQPVPGAGK